MGWTATGLPLAWDDAPDVGLSGEDPVVVDVIAGGPGFVAVGHDARGGRVWTSVDGASWTRQPDGPEWDGAQIQSVITWNGGLLAAGASGRHAAFWTSADGVSWQRIPDSPGLDLFAGPARDSKFYYGGAIGRLYVDGDELVAEGSPGCDCEYSRWATTFRSRDGQTWQRTFHEWDPGDTLETIPGGDGLLRVDTLVDDATGDTAGWIRTSADGTDWREVYRGAPSSSLYDVAAVEGGFVAVGDVFMDGTALAVTSPDGLTWTPSSGWPDLAKGEMWRIATADGAIVVVGQRDRWRPTAWIGPPLVGTPPDLTQPSEPPGGLHVAAGEWHGAEALPSALRGSTAVTLPDGRIANVGGYDEAGYAPLASAGIYDPQDGGWTSLSDMPDAVANAPAVALDDGSVVVFGRVTMTWHPRTNRWDSDRAPKPSYVTGEYSWISPAGAVLGGDGLAYVAGYIARDEAGRIDVYDPATDSWRQPIQLPVYAETVSLAIAGDSLLAITPSRVWTYSTATHRWADDPAPALLRGGYDVAAALVLGGARLVLLRPDVVGEICSQDAVRLTVEVLDLANGTWSDGPTLPSRRDFAASVAGDGIYVLGGAYRTISSDCGWSWTGAITNVDLLTLEGL